MWASPAQVLRIANQAVVVGGPVARLLIITAAWTGCRWGELAALVWLLRRHLETHPFEFVFTNACGT
ncbi:hypothetical protein [Amycolatopsis kentuckyensis]|uniref:hypothetical protein n=1 Tax=Amycolatopsis kentuckyensis TaxID=218823 RepID=UPI0035666489